MFPYPAIGVVFNIDGLKSLLYGYEAWRLFMKHLDISELHSCILVEGDTELTLSSGANEFCIGVYGSIQQVNHIRTTFESVDELGLAPFHRRFIEKIVLDSQPLPIKGEIDAFGRLVTEYWMRTDHDLCKEAGWGYAPKEIPPDLGPSLLAELASLKRPRLELRAPPELEQKLPQDKPPARTAPESIPAPSSVPPESSADVQVLLKSARGIVLQEGPTRALEYLRDSPYVRAEPVVRLMHALVYNHNQALAKKLLEEPFLDPIWCQCTVCGATWLISPLLSSEQRGKFRKPGTGLQCSSCNRVLCPQCAAAADATCPCGGSFWSITHPNGRKREVQAADAEKEVDKWHALLPVTPVVYAKDMHLYFGYEGKVPIGVDPMFPSVQVAATEEHLSWAETLIEAGVYYQAKEQLDMLEAAGASSPYLQWLRARLELVQLHNARERHKRRLDDHDSDILNPVWLKLPAKIKQRLDDVTNQMPDCGAAWLTKAQVYLDPSYGRDFPQALHSAERARALLGDTTAVLFALGKALRTQGRPAEAVDVLRKMPENAEESSLARQELDLAELEARCQSRPLDVEAALQLGRWYSRHEQLENARKLYRLLTDQYPDRAEGYYGLAFLAMRDNRNVWDVRMMEAYHLCHEALTRNPNFGLAYELLGSVFHNLQFGSNKGSFPIENPLDYYKRALTLDPTCDVALLALARDAIERGKLQPALEYLERAAALNTDIDDVYSILAVIYQGTRQFEKAESASRKAKELSPATSLTAEYQKLILDLCRFEY